MPCVLSDQSATMRVFEVDLLDIGNCPKPRQTLIHTPTSFGGPPGSPDVAGGPSVGPPTPNVNRAAAPRDGRTSVG